MNVKPTSNQLKSAGTLKYFSSCNIYPMHFQQACKYFDILGNALFLLSCLLDFREVPNNPKVMVALQEVSASGQESYSNT